MNKESKYPTTNAQEYRRELNELARIGTKITHSWRIRFYWLVTGNHWINRTRYVQGSLSMAFFRNNRIVVVCNQGRENLFLHRFLSVGINMLYDPHRDPISMFQYITKYHIRKQWLHMVVTRNKAHSASVEHVPKTRICSSMSRREASVKESQIYSVWHPMRL